MELIDAQAEEAEEAAQRVPLHRSILTGLITVIELSTEGGLVAGIVPVERRR